MWYLLIIIYNFFLEECIDIRKENCYLSYDYSGCSNPMSSDLTKMLCCCTMGKAWGSPCSPCPTPESGKNFIYIHYKLMDILINLYYIMSYFRGLHNALRN